MSRRANITDPAWSAAALGGVILALTACSVRTAAPPPSAQPATQLRHCIGEVVPLCAEIRLSESGEMEYARSGGRTLRGRATEAELEAIRAQWSALDAAALPNNEEPVGSYVTLQLPGGSRTIQINHLPAALRPLLQSIDRIGRRLHGRSYRTIVSEETR